MKTHLFQVRFLLGKVEIYFNMVRGEEKVLGEAVSYKSLENVDISAFEAWNQT